MLILCKDYKRSTRVAAGFADPRILIWWPPWSTLCHCLCRSCCGNPVILALCNNFSRPAVFLSPRSSRASLSCRAFLVLGHNKLLLPFLPYWLKHCNSKPFMLLQPRGISQKSKDWKYQREREVKMSVDCRYKHKPMINMISIIWYDMNIKIRSIIWYQDK